MRDVSPLRFMKLENFHLHDYSNPSGLKHTSFFVKPHLIASALVES